MLVSMNDRKSRFTFFSAQNVDENDLNSGDDWELSLNDRFTKIDENKVTLLNYSQGLSTQEDLLYLNYKTTRR